MKNLIKWSLPAIAAALTVGSASAVPITGAITFNGNVTLDTGSAGTATEVMAWSGPAFSTPTPFTPYVAGDSGTFASVGLLSSVTFSPNWFFNTSSPIASFWSVGGFTFELDYSHVQAQGGTPATVTVTGYGYITGNGFDKTYGTWSFSTQDPAAPTFSFSAASGASGIPDGGTTIMLLGGALSGLGLLKRKLSA